MKSEEVYMTVCALYWKTDMNKDEIVECIGYRSLRSYCHSSGYSGTTFAMSGKDVVNKIIHTEILAHTQVKILLKRLG